MCVPVRGFKEYLVSWLRTTGLENHVLIIYYIRRVLATGYKIINFIKFLKVFRATRDRISNIKSRKKRREHRSRKLEKGEGRKKDFLFQIRKIERI